MTVAKKPDHRGEHEGNRKTIARGMPGVSGVTVAHLRLVFAAGASAPGIPCALWSEGKEIRQQTSGKMALRDREAVSAQCCMKFEFDPKYDDRLTLEQLATYFSLVEKFLSRKLIK